MKKGRQRERVQSLIADYEKELLKEAILSLPLSWAVSVKSS